MCVCVFLATTNPCLQVAKCLKYLGFTTLCDVMFGLFMAAWVGARHIGYNIVVYSVYAHIPILIPHGYFLGSQDNLTGPFELPDNITWKQATEPLWKSNGMVYFNSTTRWCFLSLLIFLQGITIMWFVMIARVAIRVLRGDGADDTRSDDEAEDEEEDEYIYEEATPLEEEVGVEDIDLKNWERRAGVKRAAAHASGVSIPGHSDRKELLGRIGCEKQVD
jgi:acyl-CoA-dependent ceramide synthase